jgi:hypothetical protein
MGMYCQLRAVPADGPIPEAGGSMVSLEKAWHGLHFLLTGSVMEGAGPLAFILFGGQPVGEDDSTRRMSPDEAQELHIALSAITDEQLWSRFDPAAMTDVYPMVWDEPEADLRYEYLMYFHDLKRFVSEAASHKMALVLTIG